MVERILDFCNAYSGFIYGWPMLILFTVTGLTISFKLGFFQFRKIGHVFKNTIGSIFKPSEGEGDISPVKATCVALASVLGTGNIAGVAVAITTGGPGAVFWMWLIALFGLLMKFSEIVLGLVYREKDPKTGTWVSGYYYTVKNGLGEKWKWFGIIMTVAFICSMAIAPMTQCGAIADSLRAYYDVNPYIIGIAGAVLIALVLLGGLKSLAKFSEVVVPFMSVLYVLAGLFVMIKYAADLPGIVGLIVSSAFTPVAATGGFAGATIMLAIRWGVARGINSNEAGTGWAVYAHASSKVNHPVKQGMWGIFEVIIDTFVICSMTALSILCTGAWTSGESGAGVTATAFGIAFGGQGLGVLFLVSIIVFFAFSTCVVNAYYGEAGLNSLGLSNFRIPFRVICCISAFLGAIGATTDMFVLFDVFAGTTTVCNLVLIFIKRNTIKLFLDDYLQRLKTGKWLKTSEETVKEVLGKEAA